MARATRSAAQPDNDNTHDTAPPTRKGGNKKRKRISNADSSEQPATKQQRTSESQEPLDVAQEHPETETPTETLGAGDVPIDSADAEKILLVLESCVSRILYLLCLTDILRRSIDTQGLLDRVFPLPTEASDSASGESTPPPSFATSAQTFSFRTLLRDSSQYPLRILKVSGSMCCCIWRHIVLIRHGRSLLSNTYSLYLRIRDHDRQCPRPSSYGSAISL